MPRPNRVYGTPSNSIRFQSRYGTSYQDPAGSEMHEEADDPDGFNRWHRNFAAARGLAPPSRRRRRTSVRPAWMGGPGVRVKFPIN